jgi:hypothetical protein
MHDLAYSLWGVSTVGTATAIGCCVSSAVKCGCSACIADKSGSWRICGVNCVLYRNSV